MFKYVIQTTTKGNYMNTLKRFFDELMVSYAALFVMSLTLFSFFLNQSVQQYAIGNNKWSLACGFAAGLCVYDILNYWSKFKNGDK